jgi:hypothetical protein
MFSSAAAPARFTEQRGLRCRRDRRKWCGWSLARMLMLESFAGRGIRSNPTVGVPTQSDAANWENGNICNMQQNRSIEPALLSPIRPVAPLRLMRRIRPPIP